MSQSKYDLEIELKSCDWILEKVQDKVYAQHLYAALCNMQWQKSETWPVLKGDMWSCTWRYAGGLVADLRNYNDSISEHYMDWYCSGIRGEKLSDTKFAQLSAEEQIKQRELEAYVGEGIVTQEIESDLKKLGWHPVPYDDEDLT